MSQKSLLETNAYLQDPEHYRLALIINVSTSTAVETGLPVEEVIRIFTLTGENDRVETRPKGSAR
jgi:hypothetical protein